MMNFVQVLSKLGVISKRGDPFGYSLLTVVFAAVLLMPPVSWAYLETFDTDNSTWENWTVTNSGGLSGSASDWSSTGGNPAGHVTGMVDNDATRLYGIQLEYGTGLDVFGDLTGLTLTVDYKIDGSVTGPVGAKVRFFVGYFNEQSRYWVSNDTYSWNPNGGENWATHTVPLVESTFSLWPNKNKGDKTFAQVLQSYNDIGLVFADGFTNNQTLGFSSQQGATIHVDNFGTVPIPGAAFLFVPGLGFFAWFRKRRA